MKTDARVKYTKMVLKKALLELMQHKPVNKITVKEICERAELNRATFYAHYSDCFDLLESIEEELFGQFERSMQSYIHSFDIAGLVGTCLYILCFLSFLKLRMKKAPSRNRTKLMHSLTTSYNILPI